MNKTDHQWLSDELRHLTGLIVFDEYQQGAVNALALNLDNQLAKTRNVRQRLALEKAHVMTRDAYICARDGEEEAASDMLGVAQHWMGKAAPD